MTFKMILQLITRKKNWIKWINILFFHYNNAIDVSDIMNIHRYLKKKNNIKTMLRLMKKALFHYKVLVDQ